MLDFTDFLVSDLHAELLVHLEKKRQLVLTGVGNSLSKGFLERLLIRGTKQNKNIILVDNRNKIPEIANCLPETNLYTFFQKENPRENQQQAIQLLEAWRTDTEVTLLSTPEDLLFPLPLNPESEIITLKKGQKLYLLSFFEELINRGYEQSEDNFLAPGMYNAQGALLNIFPINGENLIKIELNDQIIEQILVFDQATKRVQENLGHLRLYPVRWTNRADNLFSLLRQESLLIMDELENLDPVAEVELNDIIKRTDNYQIKITVFPDTEDFFHLRYLSVLKYYTAQDFINDLSEKFNNEWKVIIYTKNITELKNILVDNNLPFFTHVEDFREAARAILIVEQSASEPTQNSFQNPQQKIAIITDREIFKVKKAKSAVNKNALLDFLMSLKQGDYVVHVDHGIGRFVGIDKKEVDGITKEYLKIEYAENDKLFIPTDQADKITKYISDVENPKLTRLDSSEWSNIKSKVKKETEKIAKELLDLYAKRQLAKGFAYTVDNEAQKQFEATFPYVETIGQTKAIIDVKGDMEKEEPMDRLVCGDVGFGKTEVAMRASFKAVQNGKQVALISPVTILADQHFKSFQKRMEPFGVRIGMLSRFKTAAEQRKILKDLEHGLVDIVIGTHRLLQKDVKFKDLGMIIIDEEQKFGVKQKEILKHFRCNVDVLTLTATPIPRTLNMSLNKLRDISTIMTPPPGRLPIVTEVRKYSDKLVREAILNEIGRGGQVYFLHNRVQTIEGIAQKLQALVPEASFVVAHGQLESRALEQRVLDFKEGKYQVLVSSTIIENGIDLANANTLIVNNADRFGLAQLYQLRGRVGRAKKQAYTYLLYSAQKLDIEAKKRLRAIVEAAELGSGFQVAMKDLEIRGAGEIIGVNQHGTLNAIGVSHFIRLLNQTIEELKQGKSTTELVEEDNVFVEIPLSSYIPDSYISDYKEKINTYQKMSSLTKLEEINDFKLELETEYGRLPEEVNNLFKVLELKSLAKSAGLKGIRIVSWRLNERQAELHMGKNITAQQIAYLLKDDTEAHWLVTGDKLKINTLHLGLDWVAGLRESLQKLVAGQAVIISKKK